MVSPHTVLFASRHLADTLAAGGKDGLFEAIHDRDPQLSGVSEHVGFLKGGSASRSSDLEILMGAFCYALGRQSAAVALVHGEIVENWDAFDAASKAEIKSRISAAIDAGRAGMDMDAALWSTILEMKSEESALTP